MALGLTVQSDMEAVLQSDPPSLSQSLSALSASTELARLRSGPKRLALPSHPTRSNTSLSIGGGTGSASSDEEHFTEGDVDVDVDLGDTALDDAQSDSGTGTGTGMPSLSLRTTANRTASTPKTSILPIAPLPLAYDGALLPSLFDCRLYLWSSGFPVNSSSCTVGDFDKGY